MIMKKKLGVICVALSMVLYSLTGCGIAKNTENSMENKNIETTKNTQNADDVTNDGLKIVTTIFPPFDFARTIAKDKATVTMLLKPGAESHSYEPSPADIKMIQNADLFIYTGGENDTWVDTVLESMDNSKVKTLKMVDCVDTVDEEIVEGMEEHHHHDGDDADHNHDHDHDAADHDHCHCHEHEDANHENEHDEADHCQCHEHEDANHEHEHDDADHEHDHDEANQGHCHCHEHEDANHDHEHDDADHDHDHHHEMDEHVWTSPKNAILIVNHIKDELKALDSDNAQIYEDNATKYVEELNNLDKEYTDKISKAKSHTLVFADRFPFRYLADAYNLKYYAAFTGCSTDTEADASTIAFLINKVKEENISTVFTIEMSDGKLADSVCDATGAKKEMLHSAHNLSQEEVDSGLTYLKLMQDNLVKIDKALN